MHVQNLCTESLTTYSCRGSTALEHYGDWHGWQWVLMSDLVKAAQESDKCWDAQKLGETFRSFNRMEKFWYLFNEGEARAYHTDTFSKEVPFADPRLLVPALWANDVLCLVRRGVTKILWHKHIAYALWGARDEMIKVSDLLKRKSRTKNCAKKQALEKA